MRDSVRPSSRANASRKLVLAALTSCLIGIPASAQGDRQRSDAHVYAEEIGVPLAEAQRRLALQLQLGDVEKALQEKAGDIFAGLWIEHRPAFGVEVRFTDEARGRRLLAPLLAGIATDFRVAAAPASLRQLEALQEAALAQLRAARVAADVDLDVRGNRVEILATAPDAVRSAIASFAAEDQDRVQVVPVDRLGVLENGTLPMRGGRPLLTCSSGFTARNAGGSVGVLTSAHCGDTQDYTDWDVAIPFVSGTFSGSRDVQFHNRHCYLTVPNEFDSGLGIRQVTATQARDNQVVGSQVCRYGMTTPHRCGLISSKSYCPSVIPSCSGTFVRVAPTNGVYLSDAGDSGGPWFSNTTAFGIHTGSVGPVDSFYMPINYASTIATVLTSNGGHGLVNGSMSCSGVFNGSTQITCYPSAVGGVPPFTYSNWIYTGQADSWSTYFNSIKATYLSPGCPGGANNYFAATVTDQCGSTANAYAWAPCPQGCAAGDAGAADASSLLPPVCNAEGASLND